MDKLLTENALVCPPGMEAVSGRENQRKLFKEFLGMEGVELSWDPIEAHVSPSEEMGYVYGWVNWKMPGDATDMCVTDILPRNVGAEKIGCLTMTRFNGKQTGQSRK